MIKEINKKEISDKNKYTMVFLPLVRVVLDYLAIISAESIAFELRGFFVPNGGILHISWLNFSADKWIIRKKNAVLENCFQDF